METTGPTSGTPPRIRVSQAAGAVIQIDVADSRTYYVHKNLLTQVSSYFRNALEKYFREAEDKKINLPHVKPATMESFIDWLYTGSLEIPKIKLNNMSRDKEDWDEDIEVENSAVTTVLVDLYVFGDAQVIPSLCRATLDALFDHFVHPGTRIPGFLSIVHLYSMLPPSSPLLKLVVDITCRYGFVEEEDMKGNVDAADMLPMAFLSAFFVRNSILMGKIISKTIDLEYDLEACDYHGHANQQERDECPRNTMEQ